MVKMQGNFRVFVRKAGKVVAKSQNLAVITRYNLKNSIKSMSVRGHVLKVNYANGARVITSFASPSILVDWAQKKARRFGFPLKVATQIK